MGSGLIRDLVPKGVRYGRNAGAADAPSTPGFRLPGGQCPVFLRRHFYFSKCGRTCPGYQQLRIPLQHQLHRLAAVLSETRRLNRPAVRCELAAESCAHVLADDVDVIRRDTQRLSKLLTDGGDALRGRPSCHALRVRPFHHVPVRLQAAMGDDRNTVVAFRDDDVGVLESLIGVTYLLRDCRLGVTGILAKVFLDHEERKLLVLHLDLADGILRYFLGLGGYSGDFVPLPLYFFADVLNDPHRLHAGQGLSGREVDGLDRGVGIRAAQYLGEEHPRPIDVVGVLGATARLGGAINPADALADQSSLTGGRPIVFTGCHWISSPSVSSGPESLSRNSYPAN